MECKFCSMKPIFWPGGTQDIYASSEVLAYGLLDDTELRIGKDGNNEMVIFASGPGETEFYYPRYCPQCGALLRKQK